MKVQILRGVVLATAWIASLSVAMGQQPRPQGPPPPQPRNNSNLQPPVLRTPPAAAQAPVPDLSPEQQQFLDNVLREWERRSKTVQRYRCTFKRWEYDAVFGPRDTFKTYSDGVIQYSAPDKGLFKVTSIWDYTPPAKPGEKPTYVQRKGELGEHWICDGLSVFEHDAKTKQLFQRELPPEMRGTAIADGPFPFLFGAEAEKIKRRYWVQPLPTPPQVKGEYWLEAYPKLRQDAVNYLKVHVIIDHTDFLPKGLVIFDRNFQPNQNPARVTFTFERREVNWSVALQQLNLFNREFYEPKVPFGWKKVVEKYEEPNYAENGIPATVPPPTANRTQRGAAPGSAPR
jgi:TIGR03009 family protein